MKRHLFLGIFFACTTQALGQITVELNSLPNIGDELTYRTIIIDTVVKVDNQVLTEGADFTWDFSGLESGVEFKESYAMVASGTVADSFPSADISIGFLGLDGYAKRNTTNISILGVAGDSVLGIPVPIVATLENAFVIRRAPFGFQDQFNTSTSFGVTLDASALDSIQFVQDIINGIPGTRIDSLRVTLQVDRTENVDGWGMITIPSGTSPCLKKTQTDIITTLVEVYAITFAGNGWVDLSPFLPMDIRDLLSVTSSTHQFFGATSKEILAEFTVAPDSTLLAARYGSDVSSGIAGKAFENIIDVQVFPNPTSDILIVDGEDLVRLQNGQLQLYNSQGSLIGQYPLLPRQEYKIGHLQTGLYVLAIREKGKLLFRTPLVVQKE